MKPGDKCTRCETTLERRANTFHWRGAFGDAAFCPKCFAAWEIEGEEVLPLPRTPPLSLGEREG